MQKGWHAQPWPLQCALSMRAVATGRYRGSAVRSAARTNHQLTRPRKGRSPRHLPEAFIVLSIPPPLHPIMTSPHFPPNTTDKLSYYLALRFQCPTFHYHATTIMPPHNNDTAQLRPESHRPAYSSVGIMFQATPPSFSIPLKSSHHPTVRSRASELYTSRPRCETQVPSSHGVEQPVHWITRYIPPVILHKIFRDQDYSGLKVLTKDLPYLIGFG